MNPIEILENHKTIRKYKKQYVSPAHIMTLLDVAKSAASSMGLQHYSIIHITDDELKARLANEVCGQPFIAEVPEIFLFIVDCYRNAKIALEKGLETEKVADSDRFFQGWTDACLAAQNLVAAAELSGFGTMYMGSMLNNAPKVIELLQLPKLTFPVVGVGLGIADERPMKKPRISRNTSVFENTYKSFPNYLDEIEDYDEEIENYRYVSFPERPMASFSQQIVSTLERDMPLRSSLFTQIEEQGFILK